MILMIDNYDSFTYNLVQRLGEIGLDQPRLRHEIAVYRNDEGTAEQMWTSLQKLMNWPGRTRIYCAHEYTQTNGRFALTVEPDNEALIQRMEKVERLRAEGRPTVPTTMYQEKRTNPFLRPDSQGIRVQLGMEDADDVAVFAEVRRRKDRF